MALSRIWAAFIIVSILAAGYQCVFSKSNTDIFSTMVVGKSGDTSQTRSVDTSALPAGVLQILQSGKEYSEGNIKVIRASAGNYISYRQQGADGIIATTKSA